MGRERVSQNPHCAKSLVRFCFEMNLSGFNVTQSVPLDLSLLIAGELWVYLFV